AALEPTAGRMQVRDHRVFAELGVNVAAGQAVEGNGAHGLFDFGESVGSNGEFGHAFVEGVEEGVCADLGQGRANFEQVQFFVRLDQTQVTHQLADFDEFGLGETLLQGAVDAQRDDVGFDADAGIG